MLNRDPTGMRVKTGLGEIVVDPDRMRAVLTLRKPFDGSKLEVRQIIDCLESNGIVFGVDKSAIMHAISEEAYGKPFVVATGMQAVDGEDESIIMKFLSNPSFDEISDDYPRYLADRGHVLAEKTLHDDGVLGFTVLGEEIKPAPGKCVTLPKGENVMVTPDGKKLLALINGEVVVDESGKISVLPVYEIKRDVDLYTGDLTFCGNVYVRGNLCEGVKVKAAGDLRVTGVVECNSVQTGRHLLIGKGVKGAKRETDITVGGDLVAKFIEKAKVRVGGNMRIHDGITNAEVEVAGMVNLQSGRGVLFGGSLVSKMGVEAYTIGTPLGVPTTVEVGIEPSLREKEKKYREELEAISAEMQRLAVAATLVKDGKHPAVSKGQVQADALLKGLAERLKALTVKKEEITQALDQIINVSPDAKLAKVEAKTIYPDVTVVIGKCSLSVTEVLTDVRIGLDSFGEIYVTHTGKDGVNEGAD